MAAGVGLLKAVNTRVIPVAQTNFSNILLLPKLPGSPFAQNQITTANGSTERWGVIPDTACRLNLFFFKGAQSTGVRHKPLIKML